MEASAAWQNGLLKLLLWSARSEFSTLVLEAYFAEHRTERLPRARPRTYAQHRSERGTPKF